MVGVLGLDRRGGTVDSIYAHSTVLATGGATSNWSLRTAPEELSGEGQRMAVEAGATLIDMEMMHFLPCCRAAWLLLPSGAACNSRGFSARKAACTPG
ncbi:putative succinate dehydrogenase [Pseudomonas sp. CFII64]|uniref:FAD-binding protein n=1 Tax=Pseudomonas sp. CFII64 TaxID=911242 RepID=UPI000357D976|nr:FAD-binding protein [Pseudomonas sp. CFII64]EPJ84826.1 putative succinate dehydrogenase [Pseudomonas sp. CFII64]